MNEPLVGFRSWALREHRATIRVDPYGRRLYDSRRYVEDEALVAWMKRQRLLKKQLSLFPAAFGADPLWMTAITTMKCWVGHAVPTPDCSCGLHAWADLPEYWYRGVRGAIVAWGHIVIHGDEGFRAQHAKIVALAQPPGFLLAKLTQVAAELGVPIVPRKHLRIVAKEYGAMLKDWKP